jgi:hypothetical protein
VIDETKITPYPIEEVTIYALRHTSIARQLLRGTPIRIVAVTHDTSVAMIERNYSALLADHADAIARTAMLDFDGMLAETLCAAQESRKGGLG